jgi:hypothetical protein
MLCNREYRAGYIPDRVCDVYRVEQCGVLSNLNALWRCLKEV